MFFLSLSATFARWQIRYPAVTCGLHKDCLNHCKKYLNRWQFQRIVILDNADSLSGVQAASSPKDTTQNFQFCKVHKRTYSSNICRIWSKRWRVMGTPVSGNCCWQRLKKRNDKLGRSLDLAQKPGATISRASGLCLPPLLYAQLAMPCQSSMSATKRHPNHFLCQRKPVVFPAGLLDGNVQLLNLIPQALGFVLQGSAFLLQLADVFCCFLQGCGLADLHSGVKEGRKNVFGQLPWPGSLHTHTAPITSSLPASCGLQSLQNSSFRLRMADKTREADSPKWRQELQE